MDIYYVIRVRLLIWLNNPGRQWHDGRVQTRSGHDAVFSFALDLHQRAPVIRSHF